MIDTQTVVFTLSSELSGFHLIVERNQAVTLLYFGLG